MAENDADGVPIDDALNVVDENKERFVDRFAQNIGGSMANAAMVGLAKGMGLYHEVEETAEIREVGEPDPDPDDPIEVKIDLDHPENTRVVYHADRQTTDDRPSMN